MPNKALEKYLQLYAEAEVGAMAAIDLANTQFHHSVVIPVYAENPIFVHRWLSADFTRNALLILVVNQHEQSSADDTALNQSLCDELISRAHNLQQQNNLYLFDIQNHNILLVDRFTHDYQLQQKHGVGHARKIGADIAAYLIARQCIKSHWIYSTDADAYLPQNYFSDSDSTDTACAAQVFDFHHREGRDDIARATAYYEQAIKYYTEALDWAGSDYAFYTLGSTLAIQCQAYAQVRGFPKRPAAEDFYLLNKLAKIGPIHSNNKILITLEPRLSRRIPFGTGPAVEKILNLQAFSAAYQYYNPQCFALLREWLDFSKRQLASLLLETQDPQRILATVYKKVDEKIATILRQLDFKSFVHHAQQQCKHPSAVEKQFRHWFDGFVTLRFIRLAQEHFYPEAPLDKCLQEFVRLRQTPL